MARDMAERSDGSTRLGGTFCMLASVLCFAIVDALAKGLADQMPSGEITFFRMAFGALPPILYLTLRARGLPDLRTRRLPGHILRATTFALSFVLFVAALPHINLAQASTLSYTETLMIGPLAWIFLRERISIGYGLAAVLGFGGIALVLDPSGGSSGTPIGAAGLILLSTLCGALGVIQVRRLGTTEHPALVAFYLSVISMLFVLPSSAFGWVMPGHLDLALLTSIGLVGGLGQVLMTAAFRSAPPASLHPYTYTGLVWAVLFGWVFFGEDLQLTTLLGAVVIIGSVALLGFQDTVERRLRSLTKRVRSNDLET